MELAEFRRCRLDNMPCYTGQVAYNPLFVGYQRNRVRLAPSRCGQHLSAAGSHICHRFVMDGIERFTTVQHTWLDMYLTEPRVTTALLTIDLPMENSSNIYTIHNEPVHEARGLTFRAIMRVAEQVCESSGWRESNYSVCRPGLAVVMVHIFAGS